MGARFVTTARPLRDASIVACQREYFVTYSVNETAKSLIREILLFTSNLQGDSSERGNDDMSDVKVEVGAKVIGYTQVVRGTAQSSYVGTVIGVSQFGVTIDAASGRTFFPWNAVERISFS